VTVLVLDGFEPFDRVVGVAPLITVGLLADSAVDTVEYRLTNLAEIALSSINKAALRVVIKVVLVVFE
jgi:hypothetical protein